MPTPGAKLFLGSSVAAYVNHLRRGMPRMEAEACIRELKIQKLEIDRAERMGQLMHTELVQALHHGADGGVEDRAGALPARLSRDRAERSRINAESKRSSNGSLPRPRP